MTETYHSHVRSDVFPFVPRGGTLFDLGGGDGATASAARAQGVADKVGVADMVAPHPEAQLDFNYQGDLTEEGFIERIGSEQGPFDAIIACDILEHFTDPWAMVKRLHSVLKPGGVIVASIPNVRHRTVTGPLMLKGAWNYTESGVLDRTHFRFFVRETAVELMTSSGLELEEVAPLPSGSRIDRAMVKSGVPGLVSLGALQYVVRVKKPA